MELFKAVCKFKGLDSLIGTGSVDAEGNKSIVLLNGEVIPSKLIEYQGKHVTNETVYRLHPATCGDCQIGKPKPNCVQDGHYSVNKCAVYYLDTINPDTHVFGLTCTELKILKLT